MAQGVFVVLTRVVAAGEVDDDNSGLTWTSSGYMPSWSDGVSGVVEVRRKFKVYFEPCGTYHLGQALELPSLQVWPEGAVGAPGATVLAGVQG